jgi:hypothetical protein
MDEQKPLERYPFPLNQVAKGSENPDVVVGLTHFKKA